MFAFQAVNLLIEQLVINTEKKMVSLIAQCLYNSGESLVALRWKLPLHRDCLIHHKGMFLAKLHTRSQNLKYNSLYSMGTWHAINDTYKKSCIKR
jgi:hypothetical protein